MKILVITDLYPIESKEKTSFVIKDFVEGWENLGHEVKVIRPNFLFNSFVRGKSYYKSGIYGNVENINYFLPFLGNIKNKVKTDFKPDLVIAHMPSGLIFAQKMGYKYCAAVHNSDIEVLTNPLYSFYFKRQLEKAYEKADKIACRSYVLKNKFLNLYPKYSNKTFVAPSGIKPEYIFQKQWKEKEKYNVLTCANLIKRKNIDKLIKACEGFENINLKIIGLGKEFSKLKKISKKPIFTGKMKNEDVLKEMRNADIFILPSVHETFGMVYLEAMASGCITVCSKNDGVDGIIQNGINGFLTELDIENTIQRILACENKQAILDKAYETISEMTQEKMCKNYLDNLIV